MKVYVVMRNDEGEPTDIQGIYMTHESAQKKFDEVVEKINEEVELDAMEEDEYEEDIRPDFYDLTVFGYGDENYTCFIEEWEVEE